MNIEAINQSMRESTFQEIKAAIKREQTKARFQFAEREQARNEVSTNIAINKAIN